MKEKVIVFGLGQDFECFKHQILKMFDIIACTDNWIIPTEPFWKKCYIHPNLIIEFEYNKVLICTKKYKDTIKVQLLKLGILEEEILYIDSLEKLFFSKYQEVINDMEVYKAINIEENFTISNDSLYLIDMDKYDTAGNLDPHYFAQDIWGAKKIIKNNPKSHYDIGSRLDGFIAHLLVFREVNYIDIRPLPYNIPGLHFIQSNATELKEVGDESIESLSCFHALEHFGLGRYGDRVEPDCYKKAAKNMQRILKKNGHLYIGVPIGPKDKLVFNAHRIFSISTVLLLFQNMKLEDFAIVRPDSVYAESLDLKECQNIKEYSCGLFEFIKKDSYYQNE